MRKKSKKITIFSEKKWRVFRKKGLNGLKTLFLPKMAILDFQKNSEKMVIWKNFEKNVVEKIWTFFRNSQFFLVNSSSPAFSSGLSIDAPRKTGRCVPPTLPPPQVHHRGKFFFFSENGIFRIWVQTTKILVLTLLLMYTTNVQTWPGARARTFFCPGEIFFFAKKKQCFVFLCFFAQNALKSELKHSKFEKYKIRQKFFVVIFSSFFHTFAKMKYPEEWQKHEKTQNLQKKFLSGN